jgi:hypothetical protein
MVIKYNEDPSNFATNEGILPKTKQDIVGRQIGRFPQGYFDKE